MAILSVFKSKVPSISYFFKNGKQAPFINGKFITDVESEIEELMADIGAIGSDKSKHPHLYVDPDEKEFDTEAPSYEETIRAQERAKVLAEISAANNLATNPANNISTSEAGKTAESFASTASLNGLDGLTPTSSPTPLTPAASLVPAALQAKLAALTTANPAPVATSATVGV